MHYRKRVNSSHDGCLGLFYVCSYSQKRSPKFHSPKFLSRAANNGSSHHVTVTSQNIVSLRENISPEREHDFTDVVYKVLYSQS